MEVEAPLTLLALEEVEVPHHGFCVGQEVGSGKGGGGGLC